jgi:hypothetical protein
LGFYSIGGIVFSCLDLFTERGERISGIREQGNRIFAADRN